MRIMPKLEISPETTPDPRVRQEPHFGGAHPALPQLTLGEMLQQDGLIEAEDVERILALQEKRGMRFGEAALKLRLVKEKDLQRALSVQFKHPQLDPADRSLSRELTTAHKPASPQVELLRQLRSILSQHWFAAHAALAVVSPEPRDGRSYLAANLALLCSQLGKPTLLIDADMRRPRQHEIFGADNRVGLSMVLAGRLRPIQAVQRVGALSTLSVLPVGPTPPNPLELLDRGGLRAILKELARQFSVIIVDTPAGNRHGDARVLAHGCEGALMVLRRHRTRLRDAKNLSERLQRAQVQMVGTVLNRY